MHLQHGVLAQRCAELIALVPAERARGTAGYPTYGVAGKQIHIIRTIYLAHHACHATIWSLRRNVRRRASCPCACVVRMLRLILAPLCGNTFGHLPIWIPVSLGEQHSVLTEHYLPGYPQGAGTRKRHCRDPATAKNPEGGLYKAKCVIRA